MKKIAILIILLTVVLGLTGCRNSNIVSETDVYANLVINIPWADSEQLSYRVDDASGNTIGKVVLSIEKDGEVYLLGQNHSANDSQLDSFVAVNRKTLAPVASSQIISSATAGTTELDSSYGKNRVTVTMPVVTGTQGEENQIKVGNTIIAVPDTIFDNNEIMFLGRTLPLREGYYVEFPSFVVTQLSAPILAFSVISRETLDTPAGNFDCYKVKVGGVGEDSVQSTVWLWYGVKSTHPLVKYDSDSGSFILIG